MEHSRISPQRALPTKAKVESGTSRSKSGTSVDLVTADFSQCVLGGVMYVVVVCANRCGVVCTLNEPACSHCLALPPLG